jgi:hypothetical protein
VGDSSRKSSTPHDGRPRDGPERDVERAFDFDVLEFPGDRKFGAARRLHHVETLQDGPSFEKRVEDACPGFRGRGFTNVSRTS